MSRCHIGGLEDAKEAGAETIDEAPMVYKPMDEIIKNTEGMDFRRVR